MIIKSLELKNYRNYDELSMNFASGTNLLYGDNAQGKTNILESIYLSATTKSHRGNKDRELIKFEENEAHIRIHFEKQGIDHQLDMHLKKNKAKGVAIDRIPIRRSSDLLGQIPVILFSPEDLKIVKSGPSERRKFLDIELSQMERLYLYQLTNYNKILVQRNNLLKQIRFQNNLIETLEAWDIQLVKYGSEVIKYREKFIKHLGEVCQKIHNKLTGGKEKILLEYDRDVGYDSYLTELKKKRQKDLKYFTSMKKNKKLNSEGIEKTQVNNTSVYFFTLLIQAVDKLLELLGTAIIFGLTSLGLTIIFNESLRNIVFQMLGLK